MGDVARLGVVVGLPQEAAILKHALGTSPPPIRCAGSRPARAAEGARDLIAGGAECLLSFGFAGGLDPRLRPGDIVLADSVTAPDGASYATDPVLRLRLIQALHRDGQTCHHGVVAGVDRVIASTAEKRALAASGGAVAVDMESHAVAAAGSAFAILRVVVDPAERAIPRSVVGALDDQGRIRPLALIGALLRVPADLPRLLALVRDHAAARKSLRRTAARIEPVLRPPQ